MIIYNKGNSISIILDNRITGDRTSRKSRLRFYTTRCDTTAINIEQVVRALGMKNIMSHNPNKLDEVRDALDWAISLDEASVIITRWPCALKRFSQADIDEFRKSIYR